MSATRQRRSAQDDLEWVLLESPYSGDIERNVAYAQRAMAYLRSMGFVVWISHLLWTQHHEAPDYFVSDFDPKYDIPNGGREESLNQLESIRRACNKVYFFTDYGWSSGMQAGLDHCTRENIPYECVTIGQDPKDHFRKAFKFSRRDSVLLLFCCFVLGVLCARFYP